MRVKKMNFFRKLSAFHFELYHFIILLVIVVLSQITMPIINNKSTEDLLNRTLDIYRWDTAERLAELTTSSIELLFQRSQAADYGSPSFKATTIEAIDL